MSDRKSPESMPTEPRDDFSHAQWVMAISLVLCGVVLALIELLRLDIDLRSFFAWIFNTAWLVGPYVLLSASVLLAWNSKVGRVFLVLATVLILFLSLSLVLIGKLPSGPGEMLFVVILPVCQYVICAVALVVCTILWSIDKWRHRHDRRHVSRAPSFDNKLVVEMERAMESKETTDLKTILVQAENSPDQYTEELVEAVRKLLVKRGEAPSP